MPVVVAGTQTVSGSVLITIPAGQVWQGSLNLCGGATAVGNATITTAGTGVKPANGTVLLKIQGPGAYTQVVSMAVTVIAPPANAVTLVYTATGTGAVGTAVANGVLL